MGSAEPTAWADDKAHKLRGFAREILQITTRSRDVLLPGVPVAAVFGFFANNGLDENTTGWLSCSEREREEALVKGRKPLGGDPRKGYGRVDARHLHELGPGGVEGGHVPDEVAAGDCAWVRGARSEGVKKVLGRAGVEGRAWYRATDDQVAIACWNLQRHSRQINARLPAALQWGDDAKPWDSWRWFATMSSWSAGTGRADEHFERHAAKLAALQVSRRVGGFLRLAAEVDDPGDRHTQDEWTGLRGAQKIAGGRAAAALTGEGAAALQFLDDGLGADRATVYARLVAVSS